jgi:hypothetical protein
MDEPTGMIIIKSVSNDQKEDLTVLNRDLLTEFEVKKYAPNNQRGIVDLSMFCSLSLIYHHTVKT